MPARPYLDHARLYEAHGLRVFPVARPIRVDGQVRCSCIRGAECDAPGKHPLEPGWRDAPTSVMRWWGMGGLSNIGIATGAVSGIVVLDIDPRNGGDRTLADLEDRHGVLPNTWRSLTGGGGEHVFFQHPDGFIKSRAGALGRGLDIKAEGGLIVAPPSLHVSGRRYAIDPAHHPDDVPLAPLPNWLRYWLDRDRRRNMPPGPPVRPCVGLSPYGEAALDNACRRILDAAAGQQELTINREAYGIGRLAGAGALPADFALKALKFAAQRVSSHDGARPWLVDELARKVARSFGDGLRNPRMSRR